MSNLPDAGVLAEMYKQCFERYIPSDKWDEAAVFLSTYGDPLALHLARKELPADKIPPSPDAVECICARVTAPDCPMHGIGGTTQKAPSSPDAAGEKCKNGSGCQHEGHINWCLKCSRFYENGKSCGDLTDNYAPPSPDAGEWRGPWGCEEACGCPLIKPGTNKRTAQKIHNQWRPGCKGKVIPVDRRAPWDGTERRKGEEESHGKDK